MGQVYNDSTKRPKPKENQLGILGIAAREFTHFAGNSVEGQESAVGLRTKFSRGPREYTPYYVRIYENTPIFLLKTAATLLSRSRKGTVGA